MNNPLNYTAAFSKLEGILEELETGKVQVDELAEKVNQANALILICEQKLRESADKTEQLLSGLPNG